MSGKQIKLFLVDGAPGGGTTAEITNRTGHVSSAPRSDRAELLKLGDVPRTGVYCLLGDDETPIGNPRCYLPAPPTAGVVTLGRSGNGLRELDRWRRNRRRLGEPGCQVRITLAKEVTSV